MCSSYRGSYNPKTALKHAVSLLPPIEVEMISAAGHALNLGQPERVNQRILEFLG